ncbi:hypothetical protein PR048_021459 [Dryococelus australis]|uniref:Uncharacterized protein n=1 Tax=Dryococelus australis TaxID=614101 RepID=A0ABQ9GY88_9NEOP|nr:hypothetical protein PR048_021459 [Dryococelus australis]
MDSDPKGLIRILTVRSFSNHRVSHPNRYCAMCVQADATGKDAEDHKCYENWSGSPSNTVVDIVIEGF